MKGLLQFLKEMPFLLRMCICGFILGHVPIWILPTETDMLGSLYALTVAYLTLSFVLGILSGVFFNEDWFDTTLFVFVGLFLSLIVSGFLKIVLA